MYFRPPSESPWSPPSGACLNPWLTPGGGAAGGGASGPGGGGGGGGSGGSIRNDSYWSDVPFPKEGSTVQSILNELVEQLYNDLYEIIEKEEGLSDATPPPSATTTTAQPEERTSSGKARITGVFEPPTLPPHAVTATVASSVFPSEACSRTCGKLALLYPLSTSGITEAVGEKLDESNACSVKTCKILTNWLKETYGDDTGGTDGQTGGICNSCSRAFKAFNFRVRCAECVDYDLCERCFAEGRETEGHLRSHRYIPFGPINIPLFKEQWSASEELVLLEAVGRYGFGNWTEVSEWVSTVSPGNTIIKDREACRKQYFDFHLANRKPSPTWPIQNVKSKLLYDGSLGFTQALITHCQVDTGSTKSSEHVNYTPIYDERGIDIMLNGRHEAMKDEWPSEYGSEYEQPQQDVICFHQSCKPAGSLPPRVSIVGYLPNRGEFDTEWENGYELTLCDLEIKDYETPMEKELKLAAIEAYNAVLDQRAIRKRLYLDKYILNSPSIGPGSAGGSAGGSVAAGLDFKTRWMSNKVGGEIKEIYESFRQLWRYVYTNRSDHPAALFNKNQKHYDCLSDVFPMDLEELPDLILEDALLINRLDILTGWKEANLSTLEEVVNKGSQVVNAIDSREPVYWALKTACAEAASAADAAASEATRTKSTPSTVAAASAAAAAPSAVLPYKSSLTTMKKLRISMALGESPFAQLKGLIKAQIDQVASRRGSGGAIPMVDVVIDAESEDLEARKAVDPPLSGPTSVSSNPVLSFAQRQVVAAQQETTTPVRTIPKKRRMLQEEGEIG